MFKNLGILMELVRFHVEKGVVSSLRGHEGAVRRRVSVVLFGGHSSYYDLWRRSQEGHLEMGEIWARTEEGTTRLKPRLMRLLAERLQQEGDFAKSAEVAGAAARNETYLPFRLELRAFTGLAYFRVGELDRAEKEFKEVRREIEESLILKLGMSRLWYYVNYFLGAIARTRGDTLAAEQFFRSALEASPRNARGEIHFHLGQVSYERGNFRRSSDHFYNAMKAEYRTELAEKWRIASLAAEAGRFD